MDIPTEADDRIHRTMLGPLDRLGQNQPGKYWQNQSGQLVSRAAMTIRDLDDRDVLGGGYPAGIATTEERLRWNQARLVALALARSVEPDMPNAEFVYTTAHSIYRQEEFATGTDAELAEEIGEAHAQGWL